MITTDIKNVDDIEDDDQLVAFLNISESAQYLNLSIIDKLQLIKRIQNKTWPEVAELLGGIHVQTIYQWLKTNRAKQNGTQEGNWPTVPTQTLIDILFDQAIDF